jgi:hypothetical protein
MMTASSLDDINALFTLRFILDDPKDIVDLQQDILDLQSYPERLYGSYINEWKAYVLKRGRDAQLNIDTLDLAHIVKNFEEDESLSYQHLVGIVNQTRAIVQSDKVKVIKSPLQAYIEALIKL